MDNNAANSTKTTQAFFVQAVIGVPDEKWGEHPRAFVITEPGVTLTVEEVVAHARKWIAGYKVPRDIVFADGLPRTSTGKVMKHELRDR